MSQFEFSVQKVIILNSRRTYFFEFPFFQKRIGRSFVSNKHCIGSGMATVYNSYVKPNVYLDIDGVLLANENNLSIGAVEFIKYAINNFEVYWLTTHCMHGDPTHAVEYVKRATTENIETYLQKIKPTTWSLAKTEALDFTKPFLWFDDDCYSGERLELNKQGVFNSWIEVDLTKYPDQLQHEIKLLQSFVDDVLVSQ